MNMRCRMQMEESQGTQNLKASIAVVGGGLAVKMLICYLLPAQYVCASTFSNDTSSDAMLLIGSAVLQSCSASTG